MCGGGGGGGLCVWVGVGVCKYILMNGIGRPNTNTAHTFV